MSRCHFENNNNKCSTYYGILPILKYRESKNRDGILNNEMEKL